MVVVKNSFQRTLRRLPHRKEISDKFHRHTKLADGRQGDYYKQVMTIYARILSVPFLFQISVKKEKPDGQNSLWNNIGKLVVLALKTADQEERKWFMDS